MKELILTAYHEAGHAFAAWYLKRKFKYVTIKKRGNYAGRVVLSFKTRPATPFKIVVDRLVIMAAGILAEGIYSDGNEYNPEISGAKDVADMYSHAQACFRLKGFNSHYAEGEAAQTLANYAIQVARNILIDPDNITLIHLAANTLFERERMTWQEFDELMKQKTFKA